MIGPLGKFQNSKSTLFNNSQIITTLKQNKSNKKDSTFLRVALIYLPFSAKTLIVKKVALIQVQAPDRRRFQILINPKTKKTACNGDQQPTKNLIKRQMEISRVKNKFPNYNSRKSLTKDKGRKDLKIKEWHIISAYLFHTRITGPEIQLPDDGQEGSSKTLRIGLQKIKSKSKQQQWKKLRVKINDAVFTN